MDNCFHNWGDLKTVLVGDILPPYIYNDLPKNIKEPLIQITKETQEDLNFMCETLINYGVNVVRPNVESYMEQDDFTSAGDHLDKRNKLPGQPFAVRNHLLRWHDKIFVGADFVWKNYAEQALKDYKDNIIIHGDFCASDVFRLGKDIIIDTENQNTRFVEFLKQYRVKTDLDVNIHTASIGGHSDSSVCPIKPGLLLTRFEVDLYKESFKDWTIHKLPHYLPNDHYKFHRLHEDFSFKLTNNSKEEAVDFVKKYLTHWIGYSEETTFEVNMLHVNPTTVITSHVNKDVVNLLNTHGIEVVHCPLRHKYFWDGGSHCVTFDIERNSEPKDLFGYSADKDFGQLWRDINVVGRLHN